MTAINNTATLTFSVHYGLVDYHGRRPARESAYDAPPHIKAYIVGHGEGSGAKTPDGESYRQYRATIEFSGCRAGDVIVTSPWHTQHRVHKTKKGLVVREYPTIPLALR